MCHIIILTELLTNLALLLRDLAVRRLVVVAHLVRSMTRGACDMARQHAMAARGDARAS